MIKRSLVQFLFFFVILIFLKSIVTLVIIYTDNYFYEWNFDNPLFERKLNQFILYTLLIPSGLLLIGIIALRKRLNSKLINLVAIGFLAIVLFKLFDVYIRGLVHFSTNHITNTYYDIVVFGLISYCLYLLLSKIGSLRKKLKAN